jgi:hypothetical protein
LPIKLKTLIVNGGSRVNRSLCYGGDQANQSDAVGAFDMKNISNSQIFGLHPEARALLAPIYQKEARAFEFPKSGVCVKRLIPPGSSAVRNAKPPQIPG